jgi:hypothetical protein
MPQKSSEGVECVEKCGGKVDLSSERVFIRIGCASWTPAFACSNKKCGRLHFGPGNGVVRRGGERAFWIEGGIAYKPASTE